jgi:hypothetical protein
MSKFHNFTRPPLSNGKRKRDPYVNCIAQHIADFNRYHAKFLANYYISAGLRIGSRGTRISKFGPQSGPKAK